MNTRIFSFFRYLFLYLLALFFILFAVWYSEKNLAQAQGFDFQNSNRKNQNADATGGLIKRDYVFGSIDGKKYLVKDLWDKHLNQAEESLFESLKSNFSDLFFQQNPNLLADVSTFQPTEEEMKAFYQSNALEKQGSYANLKDQLREYMAQSKKQEIRQKIFEEAMGKGRVTLFPLPVALVQFSNSTAIAKNKAEFSVAMVEFSDYQCPFCHKFQTTLQKLMATEKKVSFFYRHFPLQDIHPEAFFAANAAECAQQAGAFLDLHNWMYNHPNQLRKESIFAFMKQGLTKEKFEPFQKCLETEKFKPKVEEDLALGKSMGITGTPTSFVGWYNPKTKVFQGEMITGAQPYAMVKKKLAFYLTEPAPADF